MDTVTRAERSAIMSRIRAQDTGPELAVRRLIHGLGYRYRLHTKDLPGTPDLVFPIRKKVIFVHGCFWHGHSCRAGMNRPSSNTEYWNRKLARNKARDLKNGAALRQMGWDTLVIWECELSNVEQLTHKIVDFLEESRFRLNWYDFFGGGGMARLGLGAGWECLFANDWSTKKASAYRDNFGPSPELRIEDVAALTAEDIPGLADLIWASFPCQDLSLAGTGAGLRGKRSGTFHSFWEIVRQLSVENRLPGTIVLENVGGAITSHSGRDFRYLVRVLQGAGYILGASVLDAAKFVAQSRPRLFVIGSRLPMQRLTGLVSMEPSDLWHPKNLRAAYAALPKTIRREWVWWRLPAPGDRILPLEELIEDEPTGVDWHDSGQTEHILSLMSPIHLKKVEQAQRAGRVVVGTVYRRTRPNGPQRKSQRAEVRFDGIAGCLRTPAGGSSRQTLLVVDGRKIRSRLLSPHEVARLMGVPDSYQIPARYNDAYHLFGDGLVVPVVSHLERWLLRPLSERALTQSCGVAQSRHPYIEGEELRAG